MITPVYVLSCKVCGKQFGERAEAAEHLKAHELTIYYDLLAKLPGKAPVVSQTEGENENDF